MTPMFREKCSVLENKRVAPEHYVLKVRAPRISKHACPGQFVQILCEDSYEPLLSRPFSFLTAARGDFSVLYQVVGKGTGLLSQFKKGESLWMVGPLGNGFSLNRTRSSVLVGGGVGIPPLYHLAQTWVKGSRVAAKNIHVFLGARKKSLLLCEKEFKKLGVNLYLATEDGSKGRKGFVTEILEGFLTYSQLKTQDSRLIYACGPTPMLKQVSFISRKHKIPCEVSVEVPMACGFGACLGCAIKVRGHLPATSDQRPATDYRFAIACTEGPVFKATEVLWD